MILLKINPIKTFMNDLLVDDKFDSFLVSEVSITTYNTFIIDGHVHKSFYTEEEYDELPEKNFSFWQTIKPICYSLIKGRKIPNKFKIIFLLSAKAVPPFIESHALHLSPNDINGLYMNLKYEDNTLTCTTGVSLNLFTLDKGLENAWDESIRDFLSCYE